MAKKKTPNAPPALPPAVRVAVHPPKETEPEEMCTLADKCIAAGAANQATIGMSPFLPPLTVAVAVVKTAIPLANGGSLTAKSNLLAGTRKLKAAIMGHSAWVDNQMADMSAADASAYAVTAGFTTSKTGTRPAITAMGVKNGPVGSLVLQCEFPNTDGRCMSFSEYSLDGQKTWLPGNDTETSHADLPMVFTAGQVVAVRLRQFLRGTGYTPWVVFTMIVV